MPKPGVPTPFPYWPFFCEENVWHLCRDEGVTDRGAPIPVGERFAVFIIGPRGRVAMRRQREGGVRPVFWDYHVVLTARGQVWDLDSTLGVPVDVDCWAGESFLPAFTDFAPRFRVVEAAVYLEKFASDRSHMRDPFGMPLKPPPPWPPIGTGMTLPRFISAEPGYDGELLDLESFKSRSRSGAAPQASLKRR